MSTSTFSTNQTFTNENGTVVERQKCEIYARVMGYYRPVSHFNLGKKSEFYSRKYFGEETSLNSKFVANFAVANDACACLKESDTIDFGAHLGLAC